MNKKKIGTDPAFPKSPTINPLNASTMYSGCSGMSKRLWIATQIAAAIYSNPYPDLVTMEDKLVVKMAYNAADELLKQENE